MSCSRKLLGMVLSAALFAAAFRITAQSGQDTNSAQAPQPNAASDSSAQVTELIKKADEQMNLTGQFQKSAEYAQQAADLGLKIGDKAGAANALNYLAAALAIQGRLAEARDVAQKDVTLAREAGDKKVLEQVLNTAGGVIGESGRYEEALAYFNECLDTARDIDDQTMQYMSYLNIGEAYTRSGEPDRAEVPLQESLRIAHELKHGSLSASDPSKKAVEMALLNLGSMEFERGNYSKALDYYTQVHLSVPQSPLWKISALKGMAESSEDLGDSSRAVELLEETIPLAEKSSSEVQLAQLVSDLGVSQAKEGQLDAALESEAKSISIVQNASGDPDLEWQIESRTANVLRALGRNEEALQHYQSAINGIESLRSVALATEEGRAGVLAKSHETYAEAADLLVSQHHDTKAFEMAERGRARGFIEMLALTRDGLPDELTPEQSKREADLQVRISSIQKTLWKGGISANEQQERRKELAAAENDVDAFHVAVRHSNPRFASIRYPEPISVGRVQSELLDNKSVLLEFMLGEKRSLVWVVSKDQLTSAVLPPRREIERQVLDFRKALTERASVLTAQSAIARIERLGSALYATLVGPIRDAIPSGANVIIVPDGILSYLPFETLVSGTRRNSMGELEPVYALEKLRISYAPSAGALAAVRSLNPAPRVWEKMLLAFGDPNVGGHGAAARANKTALVRTSDTAIASDSGVPPVQSAYNTYAERGFSLVPLPFTREEVLGIGKLFSPAQRQLYLGDSATEEAIKKERLNEYRYIHLASHGLIDESVPGLSGILFSRNLASREDGVLEAGEIMQLKLSADLITLSACSTGLGKLINGEGILGLTRAFFYAGARNVAVSLWNVNDSATSELMKAFYLNLKNGLPMDESLRQAKLDLLKGANPEWKQPYFWAAFVLVGKG